jgi:hypothetical protein
LPIRQVVVVGEPPRIASLPAACGPAERWSLHTQQFGAHWIGLAAPVVAMRFALREVDGAELAARADLGGTA